MLKTINEIDFEKRKGLLPVVVQDINTKDILMMAYVNKNALSKTMKQVMLGFGALLIINSG